SVRLHEAQSELVELAIGGLSLRHVFLALDEGRRVENHHIKTFTAFPERLERIECVIADGFEAEAIRPRIATRELQRCLGRVDTPGRCRALLERSDRPSADITADIENAGSRTDIPCQTLAIGTLVVEPTGLLSRCKRGREPQPALHHTNLLRHRP